MAPTEAAEEATATEVEVSLADAEAEAWPRRAPGLELLGDAGGTCGALAFTSAQLPPRAALATLAGSGPLAVLWLEPLLGPAPAPSGE